MKYKRCTKCLKYKLANTDNFQVDKHRKDRLRGECKKCRGVYRKQYRLLNIDKELIRSREYYYKNWDKIRKRKKDWRKNNNDLDRENKRIFRQSIKLQVIEHYGGRCRCCEEKEISFLIVHHVKGGGTKHRAKVGKGDAFYLWLKRNKFPPGYEILCANCHLAIATNKTCPHKKRKNEKR